MSLALCLLCLPEGKGADEFVGIGEGHKDEGDEGQREWGRPS